MRCVFATCVLFSVMVAACGARTPLHHGDASLALDVRATEAATSDTVPQDSPRDSPPPNDACATCNRRPSVSAGANHTCTVTPDGDQYCWGNNQFGQLGDGTNVSRAIGRRVFPPERVWAISAGSHSTCAIAATEPTTLYCWGFNNVGQTGTGEPLTQRDVPAMVQLPEPAAAIDFGGNHACAASVSGAVYCWGANEQGQLGARGDRFSSRPRHVAGIEGIVAIAAGQQHTCALRSGGTVHCWGANSSLQLGDGTAAMRDGPVTVVGLGTVVRIAAAANRTCAVDAAGRVHCWGRDGLALDSSRPVQIALGRAVEQIDLGGAHQCVRTRDGAILCWGDNPRGQLGDGTMANRTAAAPATVMLPAPAVDVSAGVAHSCAYLGDTSVWCWGYNGTLAVGAERPTDQVVPYRVYGP